MELKILERSQENAQDDINENFAILNESIIQIGNQFLTKHYGSNENPLIKAGSIDIARSINNVTVTGSFQLSKDMAANEAILTLPAGFSAPDFSIRTVSMLTDTSNVLLVIERNILKSSKAVSANSYLSFTVSYPTNDDFPTTE
ncbi:hypothetical protein FC84_GL001646 [Lapidilactobacillus dextrinicus DSM 20335]|uniref:Uncharacterized protein n=1 Tax=Lapidilactobacillus dextrinicus DSM 20335 TaxID=1423738 RepID=A0A0R2BJQ7_9LACO|nr:hypothetical protein [Lapidilactobacillus dextrinicus]KRM79466.1 hypothetical protein FC84_GL001646 [Lapidilactobacillus dextrinicus DSM 20335]QFG46698.1 hypothetical protein LH506_04230 [Lapidilactobacillus dextrinicus]